MEIGTKLHIFKFKFALFHTLTPTIELHLFLNPFVCFLKSKLINTSQIIFTFTEGLSPQKKSVLVAYMQKNKYVMSPVPNCLHCVTDSNRNIKEKKALKVLQPFPCHTKWPKRARHRR